MLSISADSGGFIFGRAVDKVVVAIEDERKRRLVLS
jgi:hypothetical protein